MGTRADFYMGRGTRAEWLGSIAWDGYPESISAAILDATDGPAYREAVRAFLASREDATFPDMGWPWPWEDSRTTDYAYAFSRGKVWASNYGRAWQPAREDSRPGPKVARFPNMKARQAVTLGPRSGVLVFGPAKRKPQP